MHVRRGMRRKPPAPLPAPQGWSFRHTLLHLTWHREETGTRQESVRGGSTTPPCHMHMSPDTQNISLHKCTLCLTLICSFWTYKDSLLCAECMLVLLLHHMACSLQLREKEMEPNTGNRGFDIRGASFQHRRPSETMQSPATAAAIAFFSPPQTQTRPGPNTPSPRKSIPQPIATRTTPQLLQATAEFCSTPSPIQHPFAFMPATPPLAPTVAARCASPMQSSGVDPLASPPEPTSSPPAPCVSQKDVWVHATTSITTASDVASCSPLQQSAPDSPSSLYTCKSFIESSPDTEGLKTPLAMHAESADGLAEQVEVSCCI